MLKIKVALFFCLVCLSTAMFAGDKKFHYGLKISPGLFWLKITEPGQRNPNSNSHISNPNNSNGTIINFGCGLFTEFYINNNFSIASGFDIVNLGGKFLYSSFNETGFGYDADNTIKIQYLEVPFTFKIRTKANDIDKIKVYGQLGVSTGINLSSTYVTDATTYTSYTNITSSSHQEIKNNTYPINMALIIGGGLEYKLAGSKSLLFGIHFENGFLNALKNNTPGNPDEYKILTRGIVLSAGIMF